MSELPSRDDTLVAISRWVGREPEVAYDLHRDLRVILNAARGWSSGQLVDREAIDHEAAMELARNFEPERGQPGPWWWYPRAVKAVVNAALGEPKTVVKEIVDEDRELLDRLAET